MDWESPLGIGSLTGRMRTSKLLWSRGIAHKGHHRAVASNGLAGRGIQMINARTSVCALMLISAAPLQIRAGERLTLHVSPAVSFAPANLTVRTTVTTDPDNRAIEIVAESLDFYRSSEIPLDGDRAPRTFVLEFRSLPGGMYRVTAVLIGASGERTRAHRDIIVRGSGEQHRASGLHATTRPQDKPRALARSPLTFRRPVPRIPDASPAVVSTGRRQPLRRHEG